MIHRPEFLKNHAGLVDSGNPRPGPDHIECESEQRENADFFPPAMSPLTSPYGTRNGLNPSDGKIPVGPVSAFTCGRNR
jgi:hypothetical protein